jgi:parvulin-like peptidyl-prolyl isomerase
VPQIVVDRIVGVVNKQIILQSELELLLEQMMAAEPIPPGQDRDKVRVERKKMLLETLIAEKLLDDEVKKLRVDVTDAEVDRVVKGTMGEHGLNEEQLKMALARQGLTLEEYREGLKKQLTKMKIIQLKVKGRVQVDDQTVKGVLHQREALNASEYNVRARHILVVVAPGSDGKAEKARSLEARKKIEGGAKFEDVAAEYSDDASNKARGGDLGVFGRNEMVREFEKEAFAAKPGDLVGPFRTEFGWHLLRVDERIPFKSQAPEKALEDIRNRLYASEVETQFNNYIEELKRNAHIERRL